MDLNEKLLAGRRLGSQVERDEGRIGQVVDEDNDEMSVSEKAMRGECHGVIAGEPQNEAFLTESEETWKAGKSLVNGAEARRSARPNERS